MTQIYRHVTDDGLEWDGSNADMAIATPTVFYVGPASGEVWLIERMILFIQDNGNGTVSTYGNASALTNGVRVYCTTSGSTGPEIIDVMGGATAKTNGDWGGMCYDMSITQPGSGDTFVLARWTFGKSGAPLRLVGARGEKFVVKTQDDLGSLIEHRIFIQGITDNQ